MRQELERIHAVRLNGARRLCAHQFDLAKIGQRCIAGLWVCRFCGERVRRVTSKPQVNS
jgi:hypothetical protein